MPVILPGILSLEQHLAELERNPERYRPSRCPHCGRAGLGCHGSYPRKADREGGGRLHPIPIPRFWCEGCRRTCSVLPQCLAPRRWYGWALQQVVLLGLLAGESARALRRRVLPGRRTIGRWWRRWQAQFAVHAEVLRQYEPRWGVGQDLVDFWTGVLATIPLSAAMWWVHHGGGVIP